MSIFSSLEKDIKYFFIILGVSSFFQFMFSEAFIFPSALPIKIPAESILLRIGDISFYIFFISLIVISLILSSKIRALLPLSLILIISPFLAIFEVNYQIYYGIEIFIIVISFAVIIETILKSSLRSILLIPSAILVIIGLIASFLIDFLHTSLFISYLNIFIISSIFFLIYAILWGKIISKRSIIAYIVGIISMYPFIMFAHEISTNRYVEMLMEMILPSALGITIYNPTHILYLTYTLSIIALSIISIIIKGNGAAGIGYFLIITTVFFGTYGYLLLFYMMVPTIGYVIMNYNEMKEKRIIDYFSKVIQKS
ncbi:cytochrome b558/566 subunit B [Sulfurisphaera javensis]|uniref:Cytochrome b558/566 subunit B n=1 Tax=Sulfurisphaera javensis TaxID=2049879 RepID=A0AAT9GMP1_9CREN